MALTTRCSNCGGLVRNPAPLSCPLCGGTVAGRFSGKASGAVKDHNVALMREAQVDDLMSRRAARGVVETEREPEPVDLASMTKVELVAYAKELGVDLAGASTKAQIIERIEAAETEREPDGDDEGDGQPED